MKRRKKESVLLFAALFITGILIYVGLANWERTPHLYEYDKKSLAKEIKAADAIVRRQRKRMQNPRQEKSRKSSGSVRRKKIIP